MLTNIPSPQKTRIPKKLLTYLLLSLVIILLGTTGYFYYQYQKLSRSPIAAQITAQEEVQKLAVDIGKLILLPKDETPTVATVTDINKLKDQGKRTDYEKTIVVVLNEAAKNAAAELAKALNVQVDKLPDGEIKPADIDILIIVGKDKS